MTIDLYINMSEDNRIGKELQLVDSLTGTLKDSCSIINPVIKIEAENLSNINYIFIPEFSRFYFVTDAVVLRENLWQLTCHVDVLESFKDEILSHNAIIARQENLWNLYQDDEMFKTYSNPVLDEIAWKSDFSTWKYFLALAGSSDYTTP